MTDVDDSTPQTAEQMTAEVIEKARFTALFISAADRAEMLYQVADKMKDSVLRGALIQGISDDEREWEAGVLREIQELAQAYREDAERTARGKASNSNE